MGRRSHKYLKQGKNSMENRAKEEFQISFKSGAVIFLIVFIMFFAVYFPTIFTAYFHHDDTLLYDPVYQVPLSRWMDAAGLLANVKEGRIMVAIGFSICSRILKSVANQDLFFKLLRLFNLFMIATTCSMFAVWLCAYFKEKFFPLLLALLIFWVPGYQLFVCAGTAGCHLYSFPLIMGAVWLLGVDSPICQTWDDLFRKKTLIRISLAVLLLVFSLFTYQLTTLFFLIPAFALFILNKSLKIQEKKVIVTTHLIVYIGAVAVYVVLYKLIMLPLAIKYYPQISLVSTRKLNLVSNLNDVWSNIHALFSGTFYLRSASIWFITDSLLFANIFIIFIGVTIFVFFISRFIRIFKTGFVHIPFSHFLQVFFLFTSIFFSVNLINICYGPTPLYRLTANLAMMIIILLVWSIQFWVEVVGKQFKLILRNIIIGGLTLLAGLLAQYYCFQYFALQSNREMLFFESQMMPFLTGKADEVILTRPLHNLLVFGDEHSRFTFSEFGYTVSGMIAYICKKNGFKDTSWISIDNFGSNKFRVINTLINNKSTINKSTDIIDMNFLLKTFGERPQPTIDASSVMDNYGPEPLLSKGQFTPWHAQFSPKYPEWIRFDFHIPITINKVSIRSQEIGSEKSGWDRGPKEFILQISDDGETWKDVMHVENACTDKGGAWREFLLPNPVRSRFARILILSNCGHPTLLTVGGVRFE